MQCLWVPRITFSKLIRRCWHFFKARAAADGRKVVQAHELCSISQDGTRGGRNDIAEDEKLPSRKPETLRESRSTCGCPGGNAAPVFEKRVAMELRPKNRAIPPLQNSWHPKKDSSVLVKSRGRARPNACWLLGSSNPPSWRQPGGNISLVRLCST